CVRRRRGRRACRGDFMSRLASSLRFSLLALMALFSTNPVFAGLYNFAEPIEGTRSEKLIGEGRDNFFDTLVRLRSIAADQVEVDSPLRKRYRLEADLAAKGSLAKLSVEQKINLSVALIRCRKYGEAIDLLAPLAAQHRQNCFIHANLGSAYHLAGDQDARAIASLEQAISAWPKDWDTLPTAKKNELFDLGWSGPEELQMYRVFEQYHLKLL